MAMTAANPRPVKGPPSEGRPQEPSMEEILASIRRIIADDQLLFAGHEGARDGEGPLAPARIGSAGSASSASASANSASGDPVQQDREAAEDGRGSALAAAEAVLAIHQQLDALDFEKTTPREETLAAAAHSSPDSERQPASDAKAQTPPSEPADGAQPLASAATAASVALAFHTLVASRFAQNSEAVLDLTRELLQPMLKAWLDERLPSLVERLVRAEIERMIEGR